MSFGSSVENFFEYDFQYLSKKLSGDFFELVKKIGFYCYKLMDSHKEGLLFNKKFYSSISDKFMI